MLASSCWVLSMLLAGGVWSSRVRADIEEGIDQARSRTTEGEEEALDDAEIAQELAGNIISQFVNGSGDPCGDFYEYTCNSGYPAYLANSVRFRASKSKYFTSFTRMVSFKMEQLGNRKLNAIGKKMKAPGSNLTQSERQLGALAKSCKATGDESSHEQSLDVIGNLFNEAGIDWFEESGNGHKSSIETLFHFGVHLGMTTPLISLSILRNRSKNEEKIILMESALEDRPKLQELKRDALMMRSGRHRDGSERQDSLPEGAEGKVTFFKNCFKKLRNLQTLPPIRNDPMYSNVGKFLSNANRILGMGWDKARVSEAGKEIRSMHLCFHRMEHGEKLNFTGTMGELTAMGDFNFIEALQPHFGNWLRIHEKSNVHIQDYETVFALLKLGSDEDLSGSFKNYLAHWFLNTICGYLGEGVRKKLCPEKRVRCNDVVRTLLPLSYATMLGREMLTEYDLLKVRALTRRLILAYAKDIAARESWDPQFRLMTMEKLEDMIVHIGYPTEFDSMTKREYNFDMETNFLKNILKIKQNIMIENCRKFHNPNILYQEKWAYAFEAANARYYRTSNLALVPPTILCFPFYVGALPTWFNLAAIGRLISHELAHAFDSKSWTTDNLGNLRPGFQEMAQTQNMSAYYECLEERFSLPIPFNTSYRFNGSESLHENSADHSGFSVMWSAFKEIEDPEPLPNVSDYFTSEQMFFLVYALVSCETMTRSRVASYVGAQHALKKFRTNVNLQSSQAFQEAFQCSPESPMYRTEEECVM